MASSAFNELYDLPADERATLQDDDEQLMLFSFRFLRQVLFGEETIAMRPDVVALRSGRYKERRETLEREAERRARINGEIDAAPDE